MSATPETQPRKTPNRVRQVVSFTVSKPAVRKLGQIKRKRRAKNRSLALEAMIHEAHAREFFHA